MNTVGQILKDARVHQEVSLSDLENQTKIKKEFILKIEKNDWSNLPDFPVVSGFVKNLANALDLSADSVIATLRRDYPPRKLRINPKPDIQDKFFWTPKLTFVVGVGLLIILVLSYLGFEYKKFVTPPKIIINNPKEKQQVMVGNLTVEGETSTDATLTVNNQLVTLDQDGNFKSEIEISAETKSLIFKAISRSGKETVINRQILIN